ncbi:S-adenosyl-L-methionine-dependent methyltransferase [Xylariaceae sp. FL0255]|nr:S-adenosyl-L-methionine-dependent methyltransferase [Xylariaceae sp. FL0255]
MAYALSHQAAVLSSHTSRTAENAAAFLLPHLRPDSHVLDMGCGPGTITTGFAKLCPSGRAVGIDQSAKVIEHATALNPPSANPNLTFQAADILSDEGLPFPDQSFDVVFTSQTLVHLPDPVKALKEAHRVLKPDGILAMREADSAEWYPRHPNLELYSNLLDALVKGAGGQGFHSSRAAHAWARQAGFSIDRMQRGGDLQVYASPEERKWWGEGHIGRLEKGTESGDKLRKTVVTGLDGSKEPLGDERADAIIADFHRWIEDVDGWYGTFQIDVLCWK